MYTFTHLHTTTLDVPASAGYYFVVLAMNDGRHLAAYLVHGLYLPAEMDRLLQLLGVTMEALYVAVVVGMMTREESVPHMKLDAGFAAVAPYTSVAG